MTFKSDRGIRWLFQLNGSILCFPYSPCQLSSVLIVFCQLLKHNNTSNRKKLLPGRWVRWRPPGRRDGGGDEAGLVVHDSFFALRRRSRTQDGSNRWDRCVRLDAAGLSRPAPARQTRPAARRPSVPRRNCRLPHPSILPELEYSNSSSRPHELSRLWGHGTRVGADPAHFCPEVSMPIRTRLLQKQKCEMCSSDPLFPECHAVLHFAC